MESDSSKGGVLQTDRTRASSSECDWITLVTAANDGKEEVISRLLQNGANFDSRCDYGFTPLHRAANGGHLAVAKLLLAHNADPNARDGLDRTALALAARKGHHHVVKLLLQQKGIILDCRDRYGRTPLHEAAVGGHYRIILCFLGTGNIDASCKDNEGQTPLSMVTHEKHKHPLTMQLLQLATSERQAREEVKRLSAQLSMERSKNSEANRYLQQRELEFEKRQRQFEDLEKVCSGQRWSLRTRAQQFSYQKQEVEDLRAALKQVYDSFQSLKIYEREWKVRWEQDIECSEEEMVTDLETVIKKLQQEHETLMENISNREVEASEKNIAHEQNPDLEQGQHVDACSHSVKRRGGGGRGGTAKRARWGRPAGLSVAR